ncbi:MAG: phosphotransferase [Anaerolineae bacterium]|nr:phosphotransferase [Anaerolineae bacterium]
MVTDDVREISAALRGSEEVRTQIGDFLLEPLQENVYGLMNDRGKRFFVKLIAEDDRRGNNELHVNQTLSKTGELPAPQLLFNVKMPGATAACWEWSAGVDLRYRHRELLPQVYAQLGQFHLARKNDGCVCSPATYAEYDSIPAFLAGELEALGSFLDQAEQRRCAAAFSLLEAGFVTTIHGDMHPGNVRRTEDGFQVVDWEFSVNSLNLLDLDYLQSLPGLETEPDDEWWNILPEESEKILPAYFEACGMGDADWRSIHLAVMAWAALRAHYNAAHYKNMAGAARSLRNLRRVLQTLKVS